ncbi:Aspartic protease [Hypsizygus marmoreus]|uniref:Aspartic protease n=1 Tax=Hypsizygus marmoreus TaxID=39966 RepID=A0A369JBB2_HYPMA|nr:Aspartic protease [Hypsizygus marmoreus]
MTAERWSYAQTYWAVPMTGVTASYAPNPINTVKANLTAVRCSPCTANDSGRSHLFPFHRRSTGTSLIYVPVAVAAAFYNLIPGSKKAPQMEPGYYSFPCSSTLKVSLNFNGKPFAINMVDFNLGKIGSSTSKDCIGGIIGHTFSGLAANLAIIGDEFLRSWYSVYDYSNGAWVGRAPSSNRV